MSPKDGAGTLLFNACGVTCSQRYLYVIMHSSKQTIKKQNKTKQNIVEEVRELTLVIKYCFWQTKIHLV